jgi:hypothetical protein
MVQWINVEQGTGEKFSTSPSQWVGSNGMVTCVGISIKLADGMFIGHADCYEVVTGTGAKYDYVKNTLAAQIHDAVGAYDSAVSTSVHAVTSGTDYAMRALKDGVGIWCNNATVSLNYDSFRIKTDGSGITWVKSSDNVAQNVKGESELSVPVMPK